MADDYTKTIGVKVDTDDAEISLNALLRALERSDRETQRLSKDAKTAVSELSKDIRELERQITRMSKTEEPNRIRHYERLIREKNAILEIANAWNDAADKLVKVQKEQDNLKIKAQESEDALNKQTKAYESSLKALNALQSRAASLGSTDPAEVNDYVARTRSRRNAYARDRGRLRHELSQSDFAKGMDARQFAEAFKNLFQSADGDPKLTKEQNDELFRLRSERNALSRELSENKLSQLKTASDESERAKREKDAAKEQYDADRKTLALKAEQNDILTAQNKLLSQETRDAQRRDSDLRRQYRDFRRSNLFDFGDDMAEMYKQYADVRKQNEMTVPNTGMVDYRNLLSQSRNIENILATDQAQPGERDIARARTNIIETMTEEYEKLIGKPEAQDAFIRNTLHGVEGQSFESALNKYADRRAKTDAAEGAEQAYDRRQKYFSDILDKIDDMLPMLRTIENNSNFERHNRDAWRQFGNNMLSHPANTIMHPIRTGMSALDVARQNRTYEYEQYKRQYEEFEDRRNRLDEQRQVIEMEKEFMPEDEYKRAVANNEAEQTYNGIQMEDAQADMEVAAAGAPELAVIMAVVQAIGQIAGAINDTCKKIFGISFDMKDIMNDISSTMSKALDYNTGMATYNTSSSLVSNQSARNQQMEYGLSSSQNYALTQTMSTLGMSGVEDLVYMNSTQQAKFAELMEKYSDWYDDLASSGALEDVQEAQLEWDMFKQELSYKFLNWFAENKDVIMGILEGVMDIAEGILDFLTLIFGSSGGNSAETNAAYTASEANEMLQAISSSSSIVVNSTSNINVDGTGSDVDKINAAGEQESERINNMWAEGALSTNLGN